MLNQVSLPLSAWGRFTSRFERVRVGTWDVTSSDDTSCKSVPLSLLRRFFAAGSEEADEEALKD